MQSLMLGLAAALLWGLHDYTIRRISGRSAVPVMLVTALAAGVVMLVPLAWVSDGMTGVTAPALGLALLSGVFAMIASTGLYRAFAIGPVRLVAPICGAYPILSVLFGIARGQPVAVWVWLGVLAVVGGIALVARGQGDGAHGARGAAILWSVLAATAFALTFALAQWAAESSPALTVTLIGRTAALALALVWVGIGRPSFAPLRQLWPTFTALAALDVGALAAVTYAGGLAHPEYAAIASSAFGLVTILLAWQFLAESMRPVQWLGALSVFGGIALLGAS